jgi:hypothetical protein
MLINFPLRAARKLFASQRMRIGAHLAGSSVRWHPLIGEVDAINRLVGFDISLATVELATRVPGPDEGSAAEEIGRSK